VWKANKPRAGEVCEDRHGISQRTRLSPVGLSRSWISQDEDFNRIIGGLTEVRKMLAAFLSSVEEQIELKSKAARTG
jgi:hypothetical protein